MTLSITMFVGSKEIIVDVLLDSGATECYIYQAFANLLKILLVSTSVSIRVQNVDGILNQLGSITRKAHIDLLIDRLHMEQEMFVTNLGNQRLILGLPWLCTWNPDIDWEKGTLQ